MKKFYFATLLTFLGFFSNAQIVNIPNANFKAKLLAANYNNQIAKDINGSWFTIDANSDGQIQASEALQVGTLMLMSSNISSLTGIESFTNLTFLNCGDNQLTALNVSTLTNLGSLVCSNNHITSLDLSNLSNLTGLNCYANNLTSLNLAGLTNLVSVGCNYNQLTTLNLSGLTNLATLVCQVNSLSTLNLTGLTSLTYLSCDGNQLTSLDANPAVNLEYLNCGSNQITNLNLNLSHLTELNCNTNPITTLDLTLLPNLVTFGGYYCPLTNLNLTGLIHLDRLELGYNSLTSLNLSTNVNLTNLGINNNQFATIDLSNNSRLSSVNCNNNILNTLDLSAAHSLIYLNCSNNNLNTLFIKNGAIETTVNGGVNFSNNPNLRYICADEGQIAEVQNRIATYGYTNCHVNSYCSFTPGGEFYTIHGNNHFDSDNNGCDAGDLNYPSLNLAFSDGTNNGNLIADTSGVYHYDVQNGTHTITPILENPSYFSVSPTTATASFPGDASPFAQDFCISANGMHNDLEIVALPIGPARPGFNATYKLIYKNKGTTTQSGTVSLAFYDPIEDFVSASPNFNSQSTNQLTWNYSNLLPFESREISVVFNLNSTVENPPVNAGNIITHTGTIAGATDETPNDNTSAIHQTVVNAYDPNDKTCVEGNQLPVTEVGKYLHYVIRFENTGSANATNIVVKDMLDTTKFDVSTLVPLHGSHPFETRITSGNKLEFIFENINLPFDDAHNDGYVAFKIKTLPTVIAGQTIPNSANIYFDYNAPIVTNTNVVTVYQPLSNVDFNFGSVFSLSPVPAKDVLNITVKQNVTISSVNIYNTLGQLVQVSTSPSETIDVSGLQTGTYFIKIISGKGTAASKFIKE